jgi:folylpolyglutamate synthase/dihydropteroate synthase
VLTTAVATSRALPADELAARWRVAMPAAAVQAVPDPEAAVGRAIATAPGPVVVAGSLYLVGAARALLVDDPGLRDPLDDEGVGG